MARGDDLQGQTAYLRIDVIRKQGANSLQLYGKYLFGEQNDVNSANKLEAGIKLRHGFSRVIMVRNDFSYSYDRLKELSNQFEDVLGLSFVLLEGKTYRLKLGPGIAAQYSEPKNEENGWELLGDVAEEFSWDLRDGVNFSQSTTYLYDPKNLDDYRFRFFSVLKCMLTSNVSVNLRYEYEFEALRAVANGRSDHRVYTTLGYKF
jgi:putative salt-induced outer membrane protein YdiY